MEPAVTVVHMPGRGADRVTARFFLLLSGICVMTQSGED
jgi:hypothetical protein